MSCESVHAVCHSWQADGAGKLDRVNSSTYQAREGNPVMHWCQLDWRLAVDPFGSSTRVRDGS